MAQLQVTQTDKGRGARVEVFTTRDECARVKIWLAKGSWIAMSANEAIDLSRLLAEGVEQLEREGLA